MSLVILFSNNITRLVIFFNKLDEQLQIIFGLQKNKIKTTTSHGNKKHQKQKQIIVAKGKIRQKRH